MKKKQIGIVTFHRSHNCGSILQAYAMQETCRQYGTIPEFIDFSTSGQKSLYSAFAPVKLGSLRSVVSGILRNGAAAATYRRLKRNWASYDKYIRQHLSVSGAAYSEDSLPVERDLSYDMYLTGSDQVWNVTIDDYHPTYFLDFVHKHPKVAYAVSQGARDINKYARNPKGIVDYVANIDYVSTREDNGQAWLESLTGKKYPVVLDPTLLHNKEDYADIEEGYGVKGLKKNRYIFVYASPLSSEYLALIRGYAKENGLEVVLWHNHMWLKHFGWLKGVRCPQGQNPGKYLALIRDARAVCTSSFHGVAFSTIYRKNFVVLENDGMRAGDDDRMTGFLKRVGLSDRVVNAANLVKRMGESPNYQRFSQRLKREQKKSFAFLDKAFGADRHS